MSPGSPPQPSFDLRPSVEPFSAGAVLTRTFSIWGRNFVPFSILCLIVFLPDFVFDYFVVNNQLLGMSVATYTMVAFLVRWILGLVATAAITYGVVQQLRGHTASLGSSIGIGLGRAVAVLGTSLLAGIAIALGCVALLIPGLIVACTIYVAVPVAVLERQGAFASLHRSGTLTSGSRWSIFGIMVVLGAISLGANKLLETIMESDLQHNPSLGRLTVYFFIMTGLAAVLSALQATASAVAYHDLRRAKEGIDVEQLAAVFE